MVHEENDKKKIKNITVGELLQKLSNIEIVEEHIKNSSVGFVKLPSDGNLEEADIIGSGTLVKFEEKYGILTAQHVITHLLHKSSEFGLSILPYEHSLIVHKSDVHVVELPKIGEHGDQPDIAFILLLGSRLESIKAIKSFWSISHYREKVLSNTWAKENCLWVISGCPGVFSNLEEPTSKFKMVKSFMNILGFSGVEREYFEQDFDYLEVSVLHQLGSGLPLTFGGVSGGGLWQIPVWESENGEIQASDPILYGLACWETEIKDDKQRIICHGPVSVYSILYDKVVQEYSG